MGVGLEEPPGLWGPGPFAVVKGEKTPSAMAQVKPTVGCPHLGWWSPAWGKVPACWATED